MGKIINCEKCGESIDHNEDLITATVILEVLPYHSHCYATDLKGANTIILSNKPLNGFASNFKVISISIIAILWAIFADQPIKWASLAAIPIIKLQVIDDFLNAFMVRYILPIF